jgi:hypothetical protein
MPQENKNDENNKNSLNIPLKLNLAPLKARIDYRDEVTKEIKRTFVSEVIHIAVETEHDGLHIFKDILTGGFSVLSYPVSNQEKEQEKQKAKIVLENVINNN